MADRTESGIPRDSDDGSAYTGDDGPLKDNTSDESNPIEGDYPGTACDCSATDGEDVRAHLDADIVEYRWILDHLLEEVRSQHSESLSLISSSTQKSGIIMAFSSVLFIELFRLPITGLAWYAALILMIICTASGLMAVIFGRKISLGADINKVVRSYNDGETDDLLVMMFNEKSEALSVSLQDANRISMCVLIQMVMLIFSLVSLVYLEVDNIGLV